MILSCPCCHARIHLEAGLQEAAARELVSLLACKPVALARPLVSYLGLWRAKARALSWGRALRLADEVLGLERDEALLAEALHETVEAIWRKRETEPPRPLTNHNYLRRVLESGRAKRPAPPPEPEPAPVEPPAGEGPLHPDVAPRLAGLAARAVKSR